METAGTVDVLIANLMARNNRRTADQIDDADWRRMFDVMVHPLYRLARAALPQMLARGRGRIVVIGRANGLRGTSIRPAYSAARGAQIAYVRSVDAEVAARGLHQYHRPEPGLQSLDPGRRFYGPGVRDLFAAERAEVIADRSDLTASFMVRERSLRSREALYREHSSALYH
jgi:NAD(P)-dependent dehydrogenase (short-subunit alcohol dehydrogenase family)